MVRPQEQAAVWRQTAEPITPDRIRHCFEPVTHLKPALVSSRKSADQPVVIGEGVAPVMPTVNAGFEQHEASHHEPKARARLRWERPSDAPGAEQAENQPR